MEWQFDDAREHLEELFSRALTDGPQCIRFRSHLIVVSGDEEQARPTAKLPGLKDAILHGPDLSRLDLERDQSPMRDIP